MPSQQSVTVSLNTHRVSTTSQGQEVESDGQYAVVPSILTDQHGRQIVVEDINNGTIDDDYILPEVPVEFSRVEEFICQMNRRVVSMQKIGENYVLGGPFASHNGNNAILANTTQYLCYVDIDTAMPSATFNVRVGLNNRSASIAKTPTGRVAVGSGLFGFTDYQGNVIAGLVLIDDNGDYDPNTSIFGTGITSSINAGTYERIGVLSDGSFIVCSASSIIYKGVTYTTRLIKINADGSINTTFMTNIGTGSSSASCGVLVNADDTMYIYGDFTTFNGVSKNRIIKLNADGTVDATFDVGTGFGGVCSRLEASGTNIYAVGSFTTWKGATHNRIVYLDATGSVVAGRAPVSGGGGAISSISLSGSELYILGSFTTYDGVSINRVAKIDIATGVLDTSFAPSSGLSTISTTNGRVLALSNGCVVVPGSTTQATRNGVNIPGGMIRIDATGETYHTFGVGFNNHQIINVYKNGNYLLISCIGIYNGLNNYNGKSLHNVISVSSEDGLLVAPLSRDKAYSTADNYYAEDSTGYYIGVTGTTLNIYRFTSDGKVDTGFSATINNVIYGLLVLSDTLVLVHGGFTTVNSEAKSGVVGLTNTGGISGSFNVGSGVAGGSAFVYGAILLESGKILIYGDFTSYNGHTTKNIARINTDGSPDTSFVSTITLVAYRVAEDTDNTLWIGSITSPYTILHLSALGADLSYPSPVINNRVEAIAIHDGKIHIGGQFTTIGGVASQYYGVLNTDGTVYHLAGTDLNARVYSILSDGEFVLIGGDFTTYQGDTVNRVVKINV